MKIIIPYASAGAGHFKAAQAVYNYFKDNYKDVDVRLVDILTQSSGFYKFNYTLGYNFLIRHIPSLWAAAFWLTSFRVFRPITRTSSTILNYFNTTRFAKFLIDENPDFIVSAHFLTSEIAARLKRENKIKSKLITVITDFGVHPYWLSNGTDIYVAASNFTREILLQEGVKPEAIKEFGIPIDVKFTQTYTKQQFCHKLGLDEHKFTLLIMTGSFGIGPIEEVVSLLHKEVQILVVCANNKKLFFKLTKKNYSNTRVFAFVDNVQELMAISDVIVTKPGGLSSVELLALELAPVFIAAIPGQEKVNMYALEGLGVGVSARNAQDIRNIVLDFKLHPEKLLAIKEKIMHIKKPYAAGELCDAICKGRI